MGITIKTYNAALTNNHNCDHPVVVIKNDSQMLIGDQYLQVLVTYGTPGYSFQVTYYGDSATAPNDILVKLAQVMANDPNVAKACGDINWSNPTQQTVHKLGNNLLAVWYATCRRVN